MRRQWKNRVSISIINTRRPINRDAVAVESSRMSAARSEVPTLSARPPVLAVELAVWPTILPVRRGALAVQAASTFRRHRGTSPGE